MTSIISSRYEETPTLDNYVRVDGVNSIDNSSYPFLDTSTLTVGHQGGAEFFRGNISEAITYNEKLDDVSISKVESYLGIKYGLTLPNDYINSLENIVYPAGSSLYSNAIVGIARDDATALDQRVSHSQDI